MFPAEGGLIPVGNHVLSKSLCQTLLVSSWPTPLVSQGPEVPAPWEQGTWEFIFPHESFEFPTLTTNFLSFFFCGEPCLVDAFKSAVYKSLRPACTIGFLVSELIIHGISQISVHCPEHDQLFLKYTSKQK